MNEWYIMARITLKIHTLSTGTESSSTTDMRHVANSLDGKVSAGQVNFKPTPGLRCGLCAHLPIGGFNRVVGSDWSLNF